MKQMRFSNSLILAICATVTTGLVSAEEEEVFKYSDDTWAAFKPGTWIDQETSTREAGKTTKMNQRVTLLKLEQPKQVFRYDTTVAGKTETTEETITLPEPWTVQWKETGEETLDCDGTKIPCRILERKHTKSDGETQSWRGKVAGNEIELKSLATIRRPDGSVETNSWQILKLKEVAKIGDREFECQVSWNVFEKKGGDVQWKYTTKSWNCPGIPGGSARVESVSVEKGAESKSTTIVTAFEIAKSE